MKKNILHPILGISFLVLAIWSCKKDLNTLVPPALSEFAYSDNSTRNFYVLSTAPGDTYKLPVGITTPLDRPVTLQLSYTSATAVAGTHYTAPATITIPAGKVLDSLTIKGIFANIPAGVSHRVVARISGGDLATVAGKDSVVMVLRRYCNVNPASLAGNYITTETPLPSGATTAPYISTVTNVVQTSPTTATATMNNIWDFNITANVIFDWTDPANFRVSLNPAAQQTWYMYQGTAATFITQAAGTTSTFSSCENKITMNFRFYTGAGTFDNWRADMTHQ
jgi:hypothetical protein